MSSDTFIAAALHVREVEGKGATKYTETRYVLFHIIRKLTDNKSKAEQSEDIIDFLISGLLQAKQMLLLFLEWARF